MGEYVECRDATTTTSTSTTTTSNSTITATTESTSTTTESNSTTTESTSTTTESTTTATESNSTTTEKTSTNTTASIRSPGFDVVCHESQDGYPVFVPHPFNCSLYFECDGLTPVLMSCPSGLYFDSSLNVC